MSKLKQSETSDSTKTEHTEKSGILHTENDGHSLKSNSELIQKHEIKNTPFTLVKVQKEEGDEIFIGLGRFRVTENYKMSEVRITGEDLDTVGKKILETNMWDVVMKILAIIIPQEVTAQIAYRDEHNRNVYESGFRDGTKVATGEISEAMKKIDGDKFKEAIEKDIKKEQ